MILNGKMPLSHEIIGIREKDIKRKYGISLSTYMVCIAGGFGLLLILLNIYQLYHFSIKPVFGDPTTISEPTGTKLVWIYADNSAHLKHVINLFALAGYKSVTSLSPPDSWDVMWSYRFPFRKEFMEMLSNLRPRQMVNHLPGTGYVTVKNELATSDLRWVPPAFSIPKDKDSFILAAQKSPSKLWVQKSNSHRGIKIISSNEVDLEAKETFVQEFMDKPLLIDGKKFDIGIYVLFTNVNPLQVYIFEDEILLRFCLVDYQPLDIKNVDKYVVGDDYIPWTDMPSLKPSHIQSRLSAKNALFTYLEGIGSDTAKIWSEICNCIAQMFILKEKEMDDAFSDSYNSKENFFEMVRVDFIIDEVANVWLMEVNMSPNLSSDAHPGNALMYQQVIYNTLALVGIASYIDSSHGYDASDVISSDQNIMIPVAKCKSEVCINSCPDECLLCNQCLADASKGYLKKGFREHQNKGSYRRLLPLPLSPATRSAVNKNIKVEGKSNEILAYWFKEKCKLDVSWCQ